jgi:hypothetical protein
MATPRIIQVAGSNTLKDAKDLEALQSEIRLLTTKLNVALQQLSKMISDLETRLAP